MCSKNKPEFLLNDFTLKETETITHLMDALRVSLLASIEQLEHKLEIRLDSASVLFKIKNSLCTLLPGSTLLSWEELRIAENLSEFLSWSELLSVNDSIAILHKTILLELRQINYLTELDRINKAVPSAIVDIAQRLKNSPDISTGIYAMETQPGACLIEYIYNNRIVLENFFGEYVAPSVPQLEAKDIRSLLETPLGDNVTSYGPLWHVSFLRTIQSLLEIKLENILIEYKVICV